VTCQGDDDRHLLIGTSMGVIEREANMLYSPYRGGPAPGFDSTTLGRQVRLFLARRPRPEHDVRLEQSSDQGGSVAAQAGDACSDDTEENLDTCSGGGEAKYERLD
jgi:hypothetical protein